ncbi:MAG TPA: DJ-1/PfpI family protein [Blastocatellia bacterium]|jgi:cyclohexyl-isocyanide hydratase|nr:DJ-1/PfpI family protein [Blastocatellia bacterium]
MKVAFIIFEGMTALDFVGIFDPVTRLKTMGFVGGLSWEVCSPTRDVSDGAGLRFVPTSVGESLEEFDLLIVPGGYGTRRLARDPEFIEWLKTAKGCRLKASVCTGSVLLGAAGFLKGKRATTHRTSFDELRPYCEEVVDRRIVDEGEVITARGVSSALDLGLYLCEKLAGPEVKEKIRIQMDYRSA